MAEMCRPSVALCDHRLTEDLEEMRRVIREADVAVAHNGHAFDFSHIFGKDSTEPLELALQGRHDIGELCARHGGGGHAVVGGVTLRGDELPRARETLAQMVRELTT